MESESRPQVSLKRSKKWGAGRLLLVDDSRMDVELALDAFAEADLDIPVHVARSGQAALDYLFGVGAFADRDRYPLPRLILLDLKMPGVDGFEVLRRVKGTPGLKRIPVVMLTSSREQGDLMMSYDIGANSYLVKPVSFGAFLEIVKLIDFYWLGHNVLAPE